VQETVTYPQYRKYKNEKCYFCILSATEFEEIQLLGSRFFLHRFQAKILPDRNLIYDMTFDYTSNWEVIGQTEYEAIRSKITA
jgi:hypothetical protein